MSDDCKKEPAGWDIHGYQKKAIDPQGVITGLREAVTVLDEPFHREAVAAVMEEAASLLEQAQRETWQPIETALKDRFIIGALISDGIVWRVHEMKHNGLAFYTRAGGSLPRMTHWMPLPQPPTGDAAP